MSTYAAHDISALSMQRIAAASGAPEPLRLSVLSAGAYAAAEAVTLTCMSRWCPAGVQRTATGAPTRWRCSARAQARCCACLTTPLSWRSPCTRVRSCRSHPSQVLMFSTCSNLSTDNLGCCTDTAVYAGLHSLAPFHTKIMCRESLLLHAYQQQHMLCEAAGCADIYRALVVSHTGIVT